MKAIGKIQEDSEKESQKKERKRQIDLSLYDQLERLQESRLRGSAYRRARPSLLCRNWKPDGKKKIILTGHGKVREERRKSSACMGDCRKRTENFKELDYENGYSLCWNPVLSIGLFLLFFQFRTTGSLERKVDAYVDALCKELEFIAERSKNKKIKYDLHRRRYADNADGRGSWNG